jgi:hypothetical protein
LRQFEKDGAAARRGFITELFLRSLKIAVLIEFVELAQDEFCLEH